MQLTRRAECSRALTRGFWKYGAWAYSTPGTQLASWNQTLVWTFIKNTGYFLLGLTLVPLGWYLLGSATTAILGMLNPSLQYNWNQFSPNGKLPIEAAVDIAFSYAAVKLMWTERKFVSIGVLCSAALDLAILITR